MQPNNPIDNEKQAIRSDLNLKDYETALHLSMKEVKRLTNDELQTAIDTLEFEANRRIKAFEEAHTSSPSVEKLQDAPVIKTDLVREALVNRYSSLASFLKSATSTVEGHQKSVQDGVERLAKYGINVSPEQYDRLNSIYDKISQAIPAVDERKLRYKIKEKISMLLEEGKSDGEIISEIFNRMDEIRAEAETENEEYRKAFSRARRFKRGR